MEKINFAPFNEPIVSMIEYKGRLWVATTRHVYRQNDAGEFEPQIFVALPEGASLDSRDT